LNFIEQPYSVDTYNRLVQPSWQLEFRFVGFDQELVGWFAVQNDTGVLLTNDAEQKVEQLTVFTILAPRSLGRDKDTPLEVVAHLVTNRRVPLFKRLGLDEPVVVRQELELRVMIAQRPALSRLSGKDSKVREPWALHVDCFDELGQELKPNQVPLNEQLDKGFH
jgi:hypothetical protein